MSHELYRQRRNRLNFRSGQACSCIAHVKQEEDLQSSNLLDLHLSLRQKILLCAQVLQRSCSESFFEINNIHTRILVGDTDLTSISIQFKFSSVQQQKCLQNNINTLLQDYITRLGLIEHLIHGYQKAVKQLVAILARTHVQSRYQSPCLHVQLVHLRSIRLHWNCRKSKNTSLHAECPQFN